MPASTATAPPSPAQHYHTLRVTLLAPAAELFCLHCFDYQALGVWTLAETVTTHTLQVSFWHLPRAQAVACIRDFCNQHPQLCQGLEWAWDTLPVEAWDEAWRTHFSPIKVGNRLVVCPPWASDPDSIAKAQASTPSPPSIRGAAQGDHPAHSTTASHLTPPDPLIPLIIEPGQGFGTGRHPSTRLALQLLETLVNSKNSLALGEASLLDVGTGSGILALAAVRLLGTSIPPTLLEPEAAAIREAKRNFSLNQLPSPLCIQGSVACLQGDFSVVIANITAPVLQALAPALLGYLKGDAALILSGMLSHEGTALGEVFASHATDVHLTECLEEDGWCAWLLTRQSA